MEIVEFAGMVWKPTQEKDDFSRMKFKSDSRMMGLPQHRALTLSSGNIGGL